MLEDNSLLTSGYQVPLNFIPGITKPYPSPSQQRKLSEQLRRTTSHSNFIGPFANYKKRVKSIELPFNKYDEQRIGKSSGDNTPKPHIHTTDCNPSEMIEVNPHIYISMQKNTMTESDDNNNSNDGEKETTKRLFPVDNNDMKESYADYGNEILDSRCELSASMPDLSNGELKRNPSIRSRKVNHSTIEISRTVKERNEDVLILSKVEDELRSKLPRTFHATASIGLMNPMCFLGGVRRNTITHTDTRPRIKKISVPFRKVNSICFDNYEGQRKKSIFAKLLSPQKPTIPTDNMYGSTVNSSPSLFTRAKSYATSRTPCKVDNGDPSSSVDKFYK